MFRPCYNMYRVCFTRDLDTDCSLDDRCQSLLHIPSSKLHLFLTFMNKISKSAQAVGGVGFRFDGLVAWALF